MKGIFDEINLGFVHLEDQKDLNSNSFGTFKINVA